jgi:hypothetical protein
MKIISASKGDLYESVEMDIRALLNGKAGKKLLNNSLEFKEDTEIHFIQKRKKSEAKL